MSTPITVGLSGSASQAISQQPVGFQEAGTYINFGAGFIAAPQDNQVNPTSTPESTATASTPLGAGSTGIGSGGSNILLYAALALGVAALGGVILVLARHHSAP